MNDSYVIIALAGISFLTTWFGLKYAIKFALNKSLIDEPDERKIHNGSIPRIGGTVFVPVAMLSALIVVVMTVFGAVPDGGTAMLMLIQFVLQMLAVMLLWVVGCVDDLRGLRYRVKFLAQFIVGAMFCASGLYIKDMHGILGIHELPDFCGWAITIFAVIYCTNAMNFIDGVDGQSSLIGLFAFLYYLAMCVAVDLRLEVLYAPVCMMLAVCLIPFLRFNVFGNAERGAKTFMGDAGSLTLGCVMVMVGIAINQIPLSSSHGGDVSFIKAFAPLFLPCLDVVRVVIHRMRNGCNPFAADKNHIHHKLLACGMSPRRVSITVSLLDAAIIVLSVVLVDYINANLVILVLLGLWTLLNMWITRQMKENNKNKA